MASFDGESSLVNLPDDVKAIIKEGKNGKSLRCQLCNSLILKDFNGKYTNKDQFLPYMKKKIENQKPEDGEVLSDFWKVEGMYTFENVGFSNTVENMKYLICADCEIGPIGFQNLSEPNSLFVAFDRVKHED